MDDGCDLIEMVCKSYESSDEDEEGTEHCNYSGSADPASTLGQGFSVKTAKVGLARLLLRWLQSGRPAQRLCLRERCSHQVVVGTSM